MEGNVRTSAGLILAAVVAIGGGAAGYWYFAASKNLPPAMATPVATQVAPATGQVAQGG